jgi:ABC-type glutathione transport system ATPase component
MSQKVIDFQNVSVVYPNRKYALDGVSFSVSAGECFALIGESGCGKTTLARAALGILPSGTKIGGSIFIDGKDILKSDKNYLRRLRGLQIGFVAQDPFSACNPLATVGDFVREAWRIHRLVPPENAVENSLEKLGIEDAKTKIKQYPNEWSGGMLQRAGIAAAAAHFPKIIIADEPTSSLDAELHEAVLDTLKKTETAVLLISHDIRLVEKYADRIAIMKDGKIIETGTAQKIFENPQTQYTQQLLNILPIEKTDAEKFSEDSETVLEAKNLTHFYGTNKIFENLNLNLKKGEILGIYGASGCGKSTLLRLLALIEKPSAGSIFLDGKLMKKPLLDGSIMPVFQDASASLDNRWAIWRIVTEPLMAKHRKRRFSKPERREIAAQKLREVGLENINLEVRPKELSGGQCQRIAIARALTAEAKIILADEPTSSLDALNSEKTMKIFTEIAQRNLTSIVIVSHDKEMLRRWCHRVFSMDGGKLRQK